MIYFKIAGKTYRAENLTDARKDAREILEHLRKTTNLNYAVFFYTKLADTKNKDARKKAVMNYITWQNKYAYGDGRKDRYVNKNGTLGKAVNWGTGL